MLALWALPVLFARQGDSFGMTPEQFWHFPFGTEQRMPLVGDSDGDGRADLLSLYPTGDGVIDIAPTSPLGKPNNGGVAMRGFGHDGIADACGPFVRRKAADLMGVFADGSVRIAWGMPQGTSQYQHNDLAAQIPANLIPKFPVKTAVGDFVGDGRASVVLVGADGRLLLLQNVGSPDAPPRFVPQAVSAPPLDLRQLAAGSLSGASHTELVWLDSAGNVYKAPLDTGTGSEPRLETPVLIEKASPDDHIAVGRFRGQANADVLVGQTLFTGGDPSKKETMPGIPDLQTARGDGPWFAADIDGNGKDDLVRYRRAKEGFGAEETYVHFSYDSTDKAKGYYCSSNDGLPDFWKLGLIKPGGLDLAALGCKVGRQDVIVEVNCGDDESQKAIHDCMDRVVKYYANFPTRNPDGTTGVAMHLIYIPPWSKAQKEDILAHFDDRLPPVEHRGIVHSLFVQTGGPLVSKGCGDNSHVNTDWRVVLHEFGHQVDLRHDGWHINRTPGFPSDTGCALYPSCMSYSYCYSLGDSSEDVGYSDGARAAFQFDSRHVSKKLPFPIDKVKFLAGSPYHFRIKASDDGKSTYVDWNWTGVFADEEVCADVNYSHGADAGPRSDIDKCQTAPVLVAHGEGDQTRVLLLYGQTSPHGSKLIGRIWLGKNRDTEGGKWSPSQTLEDSDIAGDPSATYAGDGVTWVAYPSSKGVVLRSIRVDAGDRLSIGPADLVPDSVGVQPTLTRFDGRMALLMWHNSESPVGLRFVRGGETNATVTRESPLEIQSLAPVGAVAGLVSPDGPSLWVARIAGERDHSGKTEVIRYLLGHDRVLRIADRQWLDGAYAPHRMTLLWKPEEGLPQGRLYQLSGGTNGGKPYGEQYLTMNVAYKDVGGGWLSTRYFETNFTSVSAPGACLFENNIVYAVRLHDDNPGEYDPGSNRFNGNDTLGICFYGNGANAVPDGDFDDFAHIRDYGLGRSIREVSK